MNTLEQKISNRKFVDKAKGKLMKREGFSEEEAFRYIQK
ncbi:ANTAR domain-containing protein, partial [Clostridium saudiense]|nr:ANTAR domain-containing protein [Clostridium saudiense]